MVVTLIGAHGMGSQGLLEMYDVERNLVDPRLHIFFIFLVNAIFQEVEPKVPSSGFFA